MRCDVFGASGHVTIKPSIWNWDTFYKFGVYARKVKCLTPGGLHCVNGITDTRAILCDRSAEVSRRHSKWSLATEGLNKSRRVKAVRSRLFDCGLTLHPYKTKLVYCKDEDRTETHENTSFEFLGYTFRTRLARNRYGKFFPNFLPAMSKASAQRIKDKIRALDIPTKRSLYPLEELAKLINPYVQGWINYFGKFYPSEVRKVLSYVEATLVRWAMGKY